MGLAVWSIPGNQLLTLTVSTISLFGLRLGYEQIVEMKGSSIEQRLGPQVLQI